MTIVQDAGHGALRHFIMSMTRLVGDTLDEPSRVSAARDLLAPLLANDDWLPEELAEPHPIDYRQFLLYADPLGRYSVVSFVWAPGQRTPIHDHTVWGVVGVLRGAECAQRYRLTVGGIVADGSEERLERGQIDLVSPDTGDIHQVRNAHDDRVSISIHVYGGNIGLIARHAFDARTGKRRTFVSGYANRMAPNLWWTPAMASRTRSTRRG